MKPPFLPPSLPPRPRGPWLMLFCTGIVTAAQAHPGHGLTDAGTAHLLASPDHVALLALVAFLLVYVSRQVPHLSARRWLDAAGVAVAVVTAALWSIGQ